VLGHIERQRVALALERPALPGRRQISVAPKALAGRRRLVDRFQHAVVREVRDLDGVDQREVGPFAGGHRDLELRVEIGPRQALLLDADARLAREALDQLVHHLAVGAREAVPVGDGGFRLRGAGARPRRRRRGRRGTGQECAAAHWTLCHGMSSGDARVAPRLYHGPRRVDTRRRVP